jgi:hypothetical protein
MAVVIVHSVKCARSYLVDLAFIQFLDRALDQLRLARTAKGKLSVF